MSDTGTFGFIGNGVQFPGRNNVVRDGSGGNAFGWENLSVGNYSFVGGYRNKASGPGNAAFGSRNSISAISSGGSLAVGTLNTITSSGSLAAGTLNTVTGSGSFANGTLGTCSGNYSITSGESCTASASYSVAIGILNTASGSASLATGLSCTASGSRAVTIGAYALASRYGEFAQGCYGVAISGSCQHGWLVFGAQSTSATPVLLYLDGVNATQNAVLAAGARWNCTLKIQAATTGAIDKDGSWEYAFTICRPTTAASTIIRTTPVLVRSDGSNAGAPPVGWAVAITADTTNGCPQIQFTGDSDTINVTGALHYVQSIRV